MRYIPAVEIHKSEELPELCNSDGLRKLSTRLYPLRQRTNAASTHVMAEKIQLSNAVFTLRGVDDDTRFLQTKKQCTKIILMLLMVGAEVKDVVLVSEAK